MPRWEHPNFSRAETPEDLLRRLGFDPLQIVLLGRKARSLDGESHYVCRLPAPRTEACRLSWFSRPRPRVIWPRIPDGTPERFIGYRAPGIGQPLSKTQTQYLRSYIFRSIL